jgi:hypothetical protein
MAGSLVAYSEITILDLVDTATYIYYSETDENNGTGVSITLVPASEYIGFYNGPSLEGGQPSAEEFDELIMGWINAGHWSGWQKIKGEAGDSCRESVYYSRSNNGQHPPIDDDDTFEPFEVLFSSVGGDTNTILTF